MPFKWLSKQLGLENDKRQPVSLDVTIESHNVPPQFSETLAQYEQQQRSKQDKVRKG
ncbi:hypothetical protein [uncultured Ferrimonas sp.]|uniref:hypothetical protein n=1 Tax=uncultured Ferrimonas sp. TaxID=432640 RepID=UPI00262134AD|nr:hypothetical protein [uncultured Ferrimonas sp.]